MNSTLHRSTMVTVVAWVFIAWSGLATLIFLLQNVLFHLVLSGPEFESALQSPPSAAVPPIAVFIQSHFKMLITLFLICSVFVLVSSIALLKRRNWARLIFVGFMIFGIVWSLCGAVLQVTLLPSMLDSLPRPPGAPDMTSMFNGVAVVGVVFGLGFSVLLGWIAKQLLSDEVAAEFTR